MIGSIFGGLVIKDCGKLAPDCFPFQKQFYQFEVCKNKNTNWKLDWNFILQNTKISNSLSFSLDCFISQQGREQQQPLISCESNDTLQQYQQVKAKFQPPKTKKVATLAFKYEQAIFLQRQTSNY